MSDATTTPLVPPEVDLTDFGFMPLDVGRLLKSTTWIEAADDPKVGHASMCLWCESWHQIPAASLPNNDKVLARLAMCDAKTWARIRDRVLDGWRLCSDGLLYHPTVAEKAIEAWASKTAQRDRTKNATESRRRSSRSTSRSTSRSSNGSGHDSRNDERDDERDEARHESVTFTKGQGQGQGEGRASAPPPGARPPMRARQGEPPEDEKPTPAGLVCRAMKTAGLQGVNPGDPRLLELLEQGATEAEFAGLAAEAVNKAKGFAWVLVALQGRRAEAAAIALPAERQQSNAAEATQQYLAEQRLSGEERAAADEARATAMAALRRRA